jgi:hypothetical protein
MPAPPAIFKTDAHELPRQQTMKFLRVHPLRCKLPTASKSEAIQTRTRKARVLRQSAQADIVCVAAISIARYFCKNGMLPFLLPLLPCYFQLTS